MRSLHKTQEEIIPVAERKLSILEGQAANLEGGEVRSSLHKVTGNPFKNLRLLLSFGPVITYPEICPKENWNFF